MTAKRDLNETIKRPSRRTFLKGASLAVAAVGASSALMSEAAGQTPSTPVRPASGLGGSGESKIFYVVETTAGKVQGIATAGIKQFKGIPYGASTSGKNRFMPPKKPAPWTGVRECFGHGQICPQTAIQSALGIRMMIMWDQQSGGMGEDCLVLNVLDAGRQ